jgi:hypothetical protein
MKRSLSLGRLTAVVVVLVLAAGAYAYWSALTAGPMRLPQNSIMVLAPYRYNGTWVFDDERVGLIREPFVAGVPEMIDVLVADIPDADKGFRLTFSAKPFPDYEKKLTRTRSDGVGNYYRLDDPTMKGPPMEGWICPALFKYYDEPPAELYVKADPAR